MNRALPILSFLLLTSCATHHAHYSYADFGDETPVSTAAVKGDPVAMVEGKEGGYVWTSCTEQSRAAVRKLIQQTRAKGGNAVAEVKWKAGGGKTPSCRKRWGYVLLPILLFTPAFSSAQVEGVAYKTK